MVARGSRAIAAALAAVVAVVPATALACPYCAGRANGGGWTLAILALFVSLPFFFSWAVYRFIRSQQNALAAGATAITPMPQTSGEAPSYDRSRRTV